MNLLSIDRIHAGQVGSGKGYQDSKTILLRSSVGAKERAFVQEEKGGASLLVTIV